MKTDHVCPNYSLNIVFTTFLPQLYLRDWHRLHMSLLVSYYLPQGCNDKQKLFLSIPQPAFIPHSFANPIMVNNNLHCTYVCTATKKRFV